VRPPMYFSMISKIRLSDESFFIIKHRKRRKI
jgi:hypothetical protein